MKKHHILIIILLTLTHFTFAQTENTLTIDNINQVVQVERIGDGYINDIAESPINDDVILAGSLGLWRYNKASRSVPSILINGDRSFERVTYHPNGRRFVTLSTFGNRIEMWDAERLVALYQLHFSESYFKGTPNFLEFSPDGTKLVTGSWRYIIVWDVATSSILHVLDYPQARNVLDVAFSRDSKRLIASYLQYSMLVWDLETGTIIEPHIIAEDPSFLCLAYSPNNELIAMAGYRDWLRVWNDDTGDVLWVMTDDLHVPNEVPYTTQGDTFFFTQDNSVCNQKIFYQDLADFRQSFVVNFAINDSGYVLRYDTDAVLQLFNIYTNQPMATFSNNFMNPILSMSYRPDGAQIALVLKNGLVLIYNLSNGEIERVFKEKRNSSHPDSPQIGLQYSPDSSRLIMTNSDLIYPGGLESSMLVWDVNTWSILYEKDDIGSIRYSPDGQYFTSVDRNNILVWDALTGEFISSFQLDHGVIMYTFVPDSQHIISYDWGFYVWNIQTGEYVENGYIYFQTGIGGNGYASMRYGIGEQLAIFDNTDIYLFQQRSDNKGILIEGAGHFPALAFSPDGQLFAYSLGSDIAIANAYTGELLHTLTGHHGRIVDIEFHSNGTQIISASNDGTIRIWGIPE